MSREVIGDAPVPLAAPESPRFATVVRASRQALLASGTATELKPPRLARRHAATLAAALLATSATVTFAASQPPGDPARGVVAAVTGFSAASAAATGGEARRVLLAIAIANPGRESVRVDGYSPTTRSSAATAFDEPTAHVGAGETVEITVDVNLRCATPAPPFLPQLVITEEDGGRRAVTVVGAVAALTDLCAEGPVEGHSLESGAVRRDGRDLLVDVAVPRNRRTEIRGVSAAGVPLDVGELPVRVTREPVALRLRPPPACPSAWREDGIPTRLDVEVETAGPAAVRVVVGPQLARWALDVVCGAP